MDLLQDFILFVRAGFLAQGDVSVAVSVPEDYDVLDIDRDSIKLQGVSPILDPSLEPNERDITTPTLYNARKDSSI